MTRRIGRLPSQAETVIRSPVATDFDQWVRLWAGYNAFYGRVGPSALPAHIVENAWERILDPVSPVHALVAERREGLAGLAHFILHKSTIMVADTCYLQDLFTSADARGSGVGRALIEGVRDSARGLGAGGLYWHTQAANLTARHLYDSVASDTGFIVYRSPMDPTGDVPRNSTAAPLQAHTPGRI